ncbi:MAG: DUF2231 domain-containing protein [Planctomycetota bacterium]
MLHRSFATPRTVVGLWSLIAALVLGLPAISQEQPKEETKQPAATASKLIDLARDVAPIFQKRCAECHEGDKAKNGFLIGDRDAVLGFVTPGSAADSSLWTDYLMAPPPKAGETDLRMPPDGPLPPGELAVLKLWMDEGAAWPEGTTLGDKPVETAAIDASTKPAWFRAIGYIHPAIVHFPIALLIIAAVSVLASYVLGDRYAQFAFNCLVLGFLFSIATAVMGWSFAESRGYGDWTKMISTKSTDEEASIFLHRWVGSAVAIVGLIVVIAGWRNRQPDGTRPGHFWRIGTLVLAMLVGWVGHEGGELVYGDLIGKAMSHFSK